jgi:tRNA pseudouridine55 synthase
MINGLLLVYKPKGCTSHDVINRIRRVYKIKKCGHGGTLDPMAQGLLLVFMGKALKLIDFIPKDYLDKRYLMRITLGTETDTYDATGQVTASSQDWVHIPQKEVLRAVKQFKGESKQMPPAYSAIKVGGKKSYEMARAGKAVELTARDIKIDAIELLKDFILKDERHLIIRADCSRGTYVRSLAQDLGKELKCGAHLSYLLRERVWHHHIKDAFPYERLLKGEDFLNSSAFVPFENILDLPRMMVNSEGEKHISHGRNLRPMDLIDLNIPQNASLDNILMVGANRELLAIYSTSKATSRKNLVLTPLKVFNNNDN